MWRAARSDRTSWEITGWVSGQMTERLGALGRLGALELLLAGGGVSPAAPPALQQHPLIKLALLALRRHAAIHLRRLAE